VAAGEQCCQEHAQEVGSGSSGSWQWQLAVTPGSDNWQWQVAVAGWQWEKAEHSRERMKKRKTVYDVFYW
jgi:hypothetical protein